MIPLILEKVKHSTATNTATTKNMAITLEMVSSLPNIYFIVAGAADGCDVVGQIYMILVLESNVSFVTISVVLFNPSKLVLLPSTAEKLEYQSVKLVLTCGVLTVDRFNGGSEIILMFKSHKYMLPGYSFNKQQPVTFALLCHNHMTSLHMYCLCNTASYASYSNRYMYSSESV